MYASEEGGSDLSTVKMNYAKHLFSVMNLIMRRAGIIILLKKIHTPG